MCHRDAGAHGAWAAAPTQVRAQPVAALERGALAIRGPSGLVRMR